MTVTLGATCAAGKTSFAVRSPGASRVWLCLFEGEGNNESERRVEMQRDADVWSVTLPDDMTGARYGYRADGAWAPEQGRFFDPAKLLVDPHALELDRRFVQDRRLTEHGADTAAIVPRAIVPGAMPQVINRPPVFRRGGLIYELNVRAFTMRHPDVPERLRGTVAALAHPAVIAHFKKLGVGAVELMPLVAWIDERHLPPLGLRNAWGYNPVAPMALDPGLVPGGVAELRDAVAALHGEGIGVILDVVFNHTGESDLAGGLLSLRGLDNAAYAHGPDGKLVNDTGCGNTLDFAQAPVRGLVLDAMRHFVEHCGIDGFRFDLAPIMARGPDFSASAPIFAEIAGDPVLADRVLIAEPWDVGPDGYRLGAFPSGWLEWNDRFRDDVRRFWRGDATVGVMATRLAGSSDVFGSDCRSVNFLAAHDGFTLADTLAYAGRHNEANGEQNRDGHGENFSWNNGAEGPSDDPQVRARRAFAVRAMLRTLFASTGAIMLTAGDEFGHTQQGNNNAYAQDNAITWLDWQGRDTALEDFTAALSEQRNRHLDRMTAFPQDGTWSRLDGEAMTVADWESHETAGFAYVAGIAGHCYRLELDRERGIAACKADD